MCLCRHVGGSVYLGRLLKWSLQGLSVFWEKSFFGAPTVYSLLAQDGEGHWVLDHDSDASQRVNFNPEGPAPGYEEVTFISSCCLLCMVLLLWYGLGSMWQSPSAL